MTFVAALTPLPQILVVQEALQSLQACFVEYDHVIATLAPRGSDGAPDEGILPYGPDIISQSASLVGRNIKCCNKNGLSSRHTWNGNDGWSRN